MSKKSPREFWVDQFNGHQPPSYRVHTVETKPMKLTIMMGNDIEMPGNEIIHVIEHSAYAELKEKLELAVEALELAGKQVGFITKSGRVDSAAIELATVVVNVHQVLQKLKPAEDNK